MILSPIMVFRMAGSSRFEVVSPEKTWGLGGQKARAMFRRREKAQTQRNLLETPLLDPPSKGP